MKMKKLNYQTERSNKYWREVFQKYNPNIYASKEIAEITGKHPTTVRRAKRRLGYPTKTEFIKQYFDLAKWDSYALKEMAKELRMTESGVAKAIKRLGPKFRKRKPRVMSIEYLKEKGVLTC